MNTKKRSKNEYEGHVVKSEIATSKGAYTKNAMAFATDVKKEIKKIMAKHKGKMSIDAMRSIIEAQTYNECAIANMMAVKM